MTIIAPFSSLFFALMVATSDEPVASNGVSEERELKRLERRFCVRVKARRARASGVVPFNRRV